MQKYAFYECESCLLGYAIEESSGIEEPSCPACICDMARFVGVVELPMPLPIIETKS